ncbi:MAG: hypothetical protein LGB54_02210 [Sulfurovum sp.]|nr:hypothetical protein [Sulfurovum sp.]
MKILEDKLEAMDTYFSSKKESEKWVIILGAAIMIVYLVYDQIFPYTEQLYKNSKIAKKTVQKSIQDNTAYLNSITINGDRDFYVKKYIADITKKKKYIVKKEQDLKSIDINLQKLSDMLFNQKSWSIFLNSITKKAEIRNINLKYIHNQYVDNNGSFGHVLEVSIGCEGSYKNIVMFLNDMEQNVLVTDVYGTDIRVDINSSLVIADINISVWGINH